MIHFSWYSGDSVLMLPVPLLRFTPPFLAIFFSFSTSRHWLFIQEVQKLSLSLKRTNDLKSHREACNSSSLGIHKCFYFEGYLVDWKLKLVQNICHCQKDNTSGLNHVGEETRRKCIPLPDWVSHSWRH